MARLMLAIAVSLGNGAMRFQMRCRGLVPEHARFNGERMFEHEDALRLALVDVLSPERIDDLLARLEAEAMVMYAIDEDEARTLGFPPRVN